MPAIDPQSIERVQGAGLELAPGLAQGAFGGTAHDMGVAAQRSEEPVQRCLHALVARMLKHEAHQRGHRQAAFAREVAGIDAMGVAKGGGV